jgi:hypothetical protein
MNFRAKWSSEAVRSQLPDRQGSSKPEAIQEHTRPVILQGAEAMCRLL